MEKDLELINYAIKRNRLGEVRPKRFSSGVVNRVYDLGSFVLKIENDAGYAVGVLKPQAEYLEKARKLGAKVPKAVDYGEYQGKPYLLMEKAKGKNLVYDWLNLNMKDREYFIAQICEQLRIFHSIKFGDYMLSIYQNQKYKNFKDAVTTVTNFSSIEIGKLEKQYRDDVILIEDFFQQNIKILDEKNTAVLTHNDIHLENVFHQDDKLSAIIDFDWISAAPKDYELKKILDVFYDPKKTVEAGLESLYEGYRMTEEFEFVKKYYPELFETKDLLTRLRLYLIEDIVYKIVDFQKGRWSEKVMKDTHDKIHDFYQGSWLSDIIT